MTDLIKRILKRGETSGRSDDTNEAIIRNRYSVYKKDTEPVANHYKAEDKLVIVKGEGSVDEIFNALSNCIEAEMDAQQVFSAE